MVKPPCYDEVNRRDCPKRKWCLEVGRSQCEAWVKYEEAHKAELEARNQERIQRNSDYEAKQRLMRKICKHK